MITDLEKGASDSGEVYWRVAGYWAGELFVIYVWDGVDI